MLAKVASRAIVALAILGGLPAFAPVSRAEDMLALLREAENHFSEVDSDGLGLAYVLTVAETEGDGRIYTESLDVLSDNNSAVARYLSPAKLRGDLILKHDATFRVRLRDDNRLTRTVQHRQLSQYVGFHLLPLVTTDLTREYELKAVAEERVAGRATLRFSLEERRVATIFERVVLWVDKETHQPLRATFQDDESGEIYELEYHFDDKSAEFASGLRFVSWIECRVRGTERRVRLEFHDARRIPDSVIYSQMLQVH